MPRRPCAKPTAIPEGRSRRYMPGSEPLGLALRIGALCNGARIERAEGRETVLGDPTEAALIVAAEKAGLEHAALVRDHRRRRELPLDSGKQRMVTVPFPIPIVETVKLARRWMGSGKMATPMP